MPTERKAETIAELSDALTRANLIVLTDYRGLSVADLQGLRATLRPLDAEFQVAKNTLTRIAAEQAGIEGLEPMLEGPLALGLAYGETVPVAKALSDFARTSRVLTIKAAVFEKQLLDASQVEALATLPSKEVLQSKLLGLFQSPMRRTVTVLSGPQRSVAYLLNARAESLGNGAAAAD